MIESKFEHLKINPSGLWLIKQRLLRSLRILFYRIPVLGKACRFIGNIFIQLGNLDGEQKKIIQSRELLLKDEQDAQKFGSPYGYGDAAHELATTMMYHNQLKGERFQGSASESEHLYAHIINKVSKFLSENRSIGQFVNFGVCYAHVDSILAQAHPGVHFIGIDRSVFTKVYNEEQFSQLKNLELVAGDIFDLLIERKLNDGVLFHTRTLCLLPASFIKKLYIAAAQAGIEYFIGVEPIGISRETLNEYGFSEEEKPSVAFRDGMFIHNYPGILKRSGFVTNDMELFKTNHPHEDVRFLSFIARKNALAGPVNITEQQATTLTDKRA